MGTRCIIIFNEGGFVMVSQMAVSRSCAELHRFDLSPSADLHWFMFKPHVASGNTTQL